MNDTNINVYDQVGETPQWKNVTKIYIVELMNFEFNWEIESKRFGCVKIFWIYKNSQPIRFVGSLVSIFSVTLHKTRMVSPERMVLLPECGLCGVTFVKKYLLNIVWKCVDTFKPECIWTKRAQRIKCEIGFLSFRKWWVKNYRMILFSSEFLCFGAHTRSVGRSFARSLS